MIQKLQIENISLKFWIKIPFLTHCPYSTYYKLMCDDQECNINAAVFQDSTTELALIVLIQVA